MDLYERWPGSTYADHARGNTELHLELREIFATKSVAEWLDFGVEQNTPIAPFNTPANIGDDPQFQARMGFYSSDDVGCEQLPLPVYVNAELPPAPTIAPTPGQHTDEVLEEVLGLGDAEIETLREDGVLGND